VSETSSPAPSKVERWVYWGAWILAFCALAFAAYRAWRVFSPIKTSPSPALAAGQAALPEPQLNEATPAGVILPALAQPEAQQSISRRVNPFTVIPNRPRDDPQEYTVETGDSVFAIAKTFGLKPESILWANYDALNDNPDMLSPGMKLIIPPTDGVLYQWKDGDTIEGVAGKFDAKEEDILNWAGNKLDLTNPEIDPGQMVMVPGGHREFRQWVIPTIPRGAAGVSSSVLGAGACAGPFEGAYGTGSFVWPAGNHYLSGNDYWSGHLALDIAAGMGASIYAADSGVVVFAGPAYGGYGNMVMIDHGNGYQTLYAHMSSVGVSCGSSVYQGQYIGLAGSTGHSTGPHLHFEVRYLGGFVNPWFVLPPP
jgi:murein DD-endopeptidase MepM/ murein hydrolase activator NlpD